MLPVSHTGNGKEPFRRVLCQSYKTCLDYCLASRWGSFTCSQCPDYQEESIQILIDEANQCRLLLVEVLGGKGRTMRERGGSIDRKLLAAFRMLEYSEEGDRTLGT